MPLKKAHLAGLIREQIIAEQEYQEHNYINPAEFIPFIKVNPGSLYTPQTIDIQILRITFKKNPKKLTASIKLEGSEFKEPLIVEFILDFLKGYSLEFLVNEIMQIIEAQQPDIIYKEPEKFTNFVHWAEHYIGVDYVKQMPELHTTEGYDPFTGQPIGLGVERSIRQILEEAFPQLKDAKTSCPRMRIHGVCSFPEDLSVFDVVIHLNDSHRWSREQIADWIEEEALLNGWDIYLKEEVNVSSDREADQA